jgi:DNA-directed RNA polymerase subunit RPC12/RpoP
MSANLMCKCGKPVEPERLQLKLTNCFECQRASELELSFGCGYEQDDPGWYIFDTKTHLIVASEDTTPTPEQFREIRHHRTLSDIYALICRDKSPSVDVTSQVCFGNNDAECLPLSRCVCGQGFQLWDQILGVNKDRPWTCPHCGAKLFFQVGIQVFKI